MNHTINSATTKHTQTPRATKPKLKTKNQNREQLFLDMKRSRGTFEGTHTSTSVRFGPILIEFGGVQVKVNDRYEAWYKQVLARFVATLGELVVKQHRDLSESRARLEQARVDYSTTAEIIASVTLLQQLSKTSRQAAHDLELSKTMENLLKRQSPAPFPQEWLPVDRVASEFNAFSQILEKKVQGGRPRGFRVCRWRWRCLPAVWGLFVLFCFVLLCVCVFFLSSRPRYCPPACHPCPALI